jgi:hypothetical protein
MTTFGNLQPNHYMICESPSAGWLVTTPTSVDPQFGLACFPINLHPGQKTRVLFGNTRVPSVGPPARELSKPRRLPQGTPRPLISKSFQAPQTACGNDDSAGVAQNSAEIL